MTATNITPLILTGGTWDTFGTQATRVNEIIARINDIGTYDDINIVGGKINSTPIGFVVPSDGKFNNLTVLTSIDLSSANIVLSSNQISGDVIYGGTVQVDAVELSTQPTATNHATRKDYVDTAIDNLKNQMIAYSLIFGG